MSLIYPPPPPISSRSAFLEYADVRERSCCFAMIDSLKAAAFFTALLVRYPRLTRVTCASST